MNYPISYLSEFMMRYPRLADLIEDFNLNGPLEFVIKLTDGRFVLYFELDNRIKMVDGDIRDLSEEECREIFALRVKYRLFMRSLTQEDLSERTGISRLMINRYLTMKATPSWYNVIKIARALNCSVDELRLCW